jgi:hypothetical protein
MIFSQMGPRWAPSRGRHISCFRDPAAKKSQERAQQIREAALQKSLQNRASRNDIVPFGSPAAQAKFIRERPEAKN